MEVPDDAPQEDHVRQGGTRGPAWLEDLGWLYPSDATCLMRPRLSSAALITCLIRLFQCATLFATFEGSVCLFATFEGSVCYTSSVVQVVFPLRTTGKPKTSARASAAWSAEAVRPVKASSRPASSPDP